MKFRHLQKVRVTTGYYKSYSGVVNSVEEFVEKVNEGTKQEYPTKIYVYTVKLTISNDPLVTDIKKFKESELKKRWF